MLAWKGHKTMKMMMMMIFRRMRIKWYFHIGISHNSSEKPALAPKSKWKPPKSHTSLEVFLSQIEKEGQSPGWVPL